MSGSGVVGKELESVTRQIPVRGLPRRPYRGTRPPRARMAGEQRLEHRLGDEVLRVTREPFRQALLRQRLPAADDLRGIVDAELVVLVLEQILDAAADV